MNIESYSDNTGTLRWEGWSIYMSPDGTGWSNMPYTKEQKEWNKVVMRNYAEFDRVMKVIERKKFSLDYIHKRIEDKTSTLSKHTQKWFLDHYFPGIRGYGRGTIIIGN